MSVDGSSGRRSDPQSSAGAVQRLRLSLNPSVDHEPESYEDIESDFSPLIFSSLERHLPPSLLNAPRDSKLQLMREVLLRYQPEGERKRVRRHREYQNKITLSYEPKHKELSTLSADKFFVPSFLKAIKGNTEQSFRSILSEPSPGIYKFEMLRPRICQMFLEEVENFERWVHETKFKIMRPNTLNKFGAVLDDFGLEKMLDDLIQDFIRPISTVFFPDVGGASLDSHHGFVVEYGIDRDSELGFHVDDSEVTLNICLGKEFKGGELFFRGVRCDQHVNTGTRPEEILDYYHVPGHAVLHRGRHRHGARATTSGHRVNLLVWCRSNTFRELRKYQKDCSSWCGECQRQKNKRQRLNIAAAQQEILNMGGKAPPLTLTRP